ncbi:hypothetical protein Q7P37_001411 [Cladosporium fusiforme]
MYSNALSEPHSLTIFPQGCCVSRQNTSAENEPAAPNPPSSSNNAGLPHDSSRAAINHPSSASSNPASRRASSHSPVRPNAPIRPPDPVVTSPASSAGKVVPWTRTRLDAEREAFFDTRVTGSADVWNALKLVCECLRRGEVAQAQGILDAVGLNVPDGRVAVGSEPRSRGRERRTGGVFDERGVGYDIPGWVVADPEDIVDDEAEKDEACEKGKGKAGDVGELVTLRARLSDGRPDVQVQIGMSQTVGAVRSELQERIGPRKIRLVYLGQAWPEAKTLEELGYKEGDIVSAFVFEE